LAKKYNIEKNNALDKILADGKLFNSINDALVAMDAKDSSNQKIISNSTQVVEELTEQDQKEFTEIASRLEKYKYKITNYDKNKGVWEVSCSDGSFDQNLSQLKALLKNFEK
jgi:hypothetical protein